MTVTSKAATRIASLYAILLVLGTATAWGVDLSGTVRLWAGPVEVDDQQQDQVDQRYTLRLHQVITPYLALALDYRRFAFDSKLEAGEKFFRRSDEPRLELTYDRPEISARFAYSQRDLRSSAQNQDLDVRTSSAQVDWNPIHGLRLAARYQDDRNQTADVAVFGRNTDTSLLELSALFDRPHWSTAYTFGQSSVDRPDTGFRFDQDRHELRTSYSNRLFQDRLNLSAEAQVRLLRQVQEIPVGERFLRPAPLREGLFAVDTSPEIGELEPVAGLTDGDLETSTQPPIEIGGANTYRNIGADLGFSRTITEIELTVDAPSSPDLLWEVYHGPDNLDWVSVGAVTSEYDATLLRYILHFPATTDAYFKAVNISVNALNQVKVTEIRFFEETDQLGRVDGDATTYRAHVHASYDATDRITAMVSAGLRNEEDLAGGVLSRDIDDQNYLAGLRFYFREDLTLRLGYEFATYAENTEPLLEREEERYSAVLEWDPLPTADFILAASSRTERDEAELLRNNEGISLTARARLLPDLTLTSELSYSNSDDSLAGFERSSWQFQETLESRPTQRWTLSETFSYTRYDGKGAFQLSQRTLFQLRTSWAPVPYLNLTGQWELADDDLQQTVNQRYSISWSPGRKFSASISYQDFNTQETRQTTGSSASINYQPNRWARLWVNFTQSELEDAFAGVSDTRAARIGMNLLF